jgi:uncharacterized radical SAM superfamily protein
LILGICYILYTIIYYFIQPNIEFGDKIPAQKKNTKILKVFNPGRTFPAISLSGSKCKLSCAHCGGQYLKQMLQVHSPESLIALCEKLDKHGTIGLLISGGCDSDGHVMLDGYFDALAAIKKRTNLILNIHTGILSEKDAKQLAKTAVDFISVDLVGDSSTIQNVYGLIHKPSKYISLLKTLKKEGIKNIVPHICIGLDFGEIKGEFNAMDMISCIEPHAIVFIIMIPTLGSKMAHYSPPTKNEVLNVITYARSKYATLPMYLGCMRPRSTTYQNYRQEIEIGAIDIGVDGIVLPSKHTITYAQQEGLSIRSYKTCCAVV